MKKIIFSATAVIAIATSVILYSCQKENVSPSTNASSAAIVKDESKMTLKEFGESRWVKEEKDFFAKTTITNNAATFNEFIAKSGTSRAALAAKPIIRFRWHGTDPRGSGCETPLGICIIIGAADAAMAAPDMVSVEVAALNGKFIIKFPEGVQSNFGLTADGIMPLLVDVSMPANVARELGLDNNAKIKAGIYRANYDAARNRYTGIALDLL